MTYLGYIFVPIGLAGLVLSKKWLYGLFIFWTLFSASSVLNIGSDESGSAVQVWMLLGAFWLLRLFLDGIRTVSFVLDRRILRPSLWLVAFLGVASLSLLMPLYINGSLLITSPVLGKNTDTPLFLTAHNITQLMYLCFGILISIAVAQVNLQPENRNDTEQVLLFSACILALWGLFQFICNLTGIPYPDFILNNSGSSSGKGFIETVEGAGIGRISSATLEPSVLAICLLSLLPLTFPAWIRKGSVFSPLIDRVISFVLIAVLFLSTSSAAYLGMSILCAVLLPVSVRTKLLSATRAIRIAAVSSAVTATLLAVLIASTPILSVLFNALLVDKASSGSGIERYMTIQLAFGYFQKFPILGIGWGSATSHDLIIFLLSNVGVLGALTFLAAMASALHASWRGMDSLHSPVDLSRVAWFIGLSIFLVNSLLTGFPLSLGSFWVVLGMAIATSQNGFSPHMEDFLRESQ